ncbi:hypothetical protein M758_UG209000 [Ceratodon purpureus]|nr:hypothetical protein M758_UG209000 [Ceratodon purpureus]
MYDCSFDLTTYTWPTSVNSSRNADNYDASSEDEGSAKDDQGKKKKSVGRESAPRMSIAERPTNTTHSRHRKEEELSKMEEQTILASKITLLLSALFDCGLFHVTSSLTHAYVTPCAVKKRCREEGYRGEAQ